MSKNLKRRCERGEVSMAAMQVNSRWAAYDMRVAQIDQDDGSVTPFLNDGTVMVPLRAVAEGLNGSFTQEGEQVTVFLNDARVTLTAGKDGVTEKKDNVFVPLTMFEELFGLDTVHYTEDPHFKDVFVISKTDLSAFPLPQNVMAVECLTAREKNLREYVSMEVPKALFDLANPLPVIDMPAPDQLTIGTMDYVMKYSELYPFPEEAVKREGVPSGAITHYHMDDCRMYPGIAHDVDVYIPVQYDGKTPAKLLIMTDGDWNVEGTNGPAVPVLLDNMIYDGRLPVIIGLFISFGKTGDGNPTYGYSGAWLDNRSTEYDSVDERFANFVVDEVMPLALKGLNISPDPLDRAIYGMSSGGPAALGVAWHRNEAVGSVFSAMGSFANIRGAFVWPYALRREKKNIRVFYLSGERDAHLVFGNWYNIGREMANSLEYSGYEYVYAVGKGGHGFWLWSVLPGVLEWLFTGKPFRQDHVQVLTGKIDESLIEK